MPNKKPVSVILKMTLLSGHCFLTSVVEGPRSKYV